MSLAKIVTCLVLLGWSARADPVEDFGPRRELAGHVFYPSLIVTDPFISTYFALFTAAGYEWIDGPNFDLRGNLLDTTRSYHAMAMAQGATFQANVSDVIALRLTGGGGINGGSSARSAVVVGMIQPISAGAGLTASGRLGEKARVGFTFDFLYTRSTLIQPLVAIQESILSSSVILSGVSERLDAYEALPAVTVAAAPSASLGVLAAVQYSWTHQTDQTSRNLQYVTLGASAQYDFLPSCGLPIGLLGSYRATLPFDSDVRLTNTVEGGLFYTGRKDLDLGLDVQGKWFDLHPEHRIRLDTTSLTALLELRYHWN